MSRAVTRTCDADECDRKWTGGDAIIVEIGDDEFDFCSWDCLLRYGAKASEPGERVPLTPSSTWVDE